MFGMIIMDRAARGRMLLAAVVAAMAVWSGCWRPPNAQPDAAAVAANRDQAANSYEIVIDNFTFSPAKLTIPVGATVHWVNRDDVPHTATSSSRPRAFDSGALDTDDRFAHQIDVAGTYDYFCAVHPHMTGQIIVK